MMLGIKRKNIMLAEHDPGWENSAAQTIKQLRCILGLTAKDIQHVGSTAIKGIKAKPVIDIAVEVNDFDEVLNFTPEMEKEGFFFRGFEGKERQPVFQCGEYIQGEDDMRLLTHYIHIVKADSTQWHSYINFRDYMNACPSAASEYEALKLQLASESGSDGSLHSYHMGKQDYVAGMIEVAHLWNDLGRKFTRIEPITKGMSGDKKFFAEATDGKYLLRVSEMSEYDRKRAEFKLVEKMAALTIPMPQPVAFGKCDNGNCVYTLLTWIDGREVEEVLPTLSEAEQYALGTKSGEILRRIHAIPAPENSADWAERYFAVIDERLNAFRAEGVPFDGDNLILDFLESNRFLLNGRPQLRHHGDYHEGNMIISDGGTLSVIDWHMVDFDNFGDPWYEFNRIVVAFPAFASGQINGYFHNVPPTEFWKLLAYYLSASAITSIVWSKYFAPERLAEILRLNEDVLRWFDNMKNFVPTWYQTTFRS
ncbi:MAG: GrpB family protein [Oscillospiraceae bacterium]